MRDWSTAEFEKLPDTITKDSDLPPKIHGDFAAPYHTYVMTNDSCPTGIKISED